MIVRIGRTYDDSRVEETGHIESVSRASRAERVAGRQIEMVIRLATNKLVVFSMSPIEAFEWRAKLNFVLTVEDGGVDIKI